MVHGFLSSAPHKNVFIIVSLQAFFNEHCTGLCTVQTSVCLSVGISCNFMLSDVYYFEKNLSFHFESLYLLLCTCVLVVLTKTNESKFIPFIHINQSSSK